MATESTTAAPQATAQGAATPPAQAPAAAGTPAAAAAPTTQPTDILGGGQPATAAAVATTQGPTKAPAAPAQQTTTTADGKTTSGEPAKAAPPTKVEIKPPEGVEIDAATLGKFAEVAQKSGLTSEQAQGAINFYAEQLKASEAMLEQAKTQSMKAWEDEVRADKELGGPNYDSTVALARKAMDRFGGEPLKAVFAELGVGNHPALVRAFTQIGKTIAEDTIGSKTNGAAPPSKEFRPIDIYPSMQPKQ